MHRPLTKYQTYAVLAACLLWIGIVIILAAVLP